MIARFSMQRSNALLDILNTTLSSTNNLPLPAGLPKIEISKEKMQIGINMIEIVIPNAPKRKNLICNATRNV